MTQQDIADQLAIQQLVSNYAIFVDLRNRDAYADLFIEDAVVCGPGFDMRGDVATPTIDTLTAMYDATMHNVHNYAYTISGDSATGITHCVASHFKQQGEQKTKMDMYIRYHDELVKQGGRWRFKKRELAVLATTTVPVN